MSILDMFKGDPFTVQSLTDATNKLPFVPGYLGSAIDWAENGVTTTSIAIEEKAGVLSIVNPTPRGGPGSDIAKQKRVLRQLRVPHYQRDDAIMADEVQGVREFGQENQVQTVQGVLMARVAEHMSDFDITLEYQRLGAITGIILNGDGSTLYNLFTEFGVSAQGEVDFNLDSTSDDGALLATCTGVVRTVGRALGGQSFRGVGAVCSDGFWDALMSNTERRKTYQAQNASQLRDGNAWGEFSMGGITFVNYRGATGTEEATAFIAADKAYFYPIGAPRVFRTVYAPADYIETVNTVGLPRYTKQYPMPNDKGIAIEMQTNALSYCTRPRALVKGKKT